MSRPLSLADLPEDTRTFASEQLRAGRFTSIEAPVAADLKVLEEREARANAKIAALRDAIEEGERSGLAEGDSFARARAQLGLASAGR